jgi:hypothetical protein
MNNRSEQEIMDSINTSLDRIEATMDDMQYKLERIAEELGVGEDKENDMNTSRNDIYTQLRNHKNTTLTYDGEIMFKYKNNDNE